MKNVLRIGMISILSILLLTPSVGAIYTGEEEAPKEGEFQMTKTLEQGEVIEIISEDGAASAETRVSEPAPEQRVTEVLESNESAKKNLIVALVIGGLIIIIGVISKRKK